MTAVINNFFMVSMCRRNEELNDQTTGREWEREREQFIHRIYFSHVGEASSFQLSWQTMECSLLREEKVSLLRTPAWASTSSSGLLSPEKQINCFDEFLFPCISHSCILLSVQSETFRTRPVVNTIHWFRFIDARRIMDESTSSRWVLSLFFSLFPIPQRSTVASPTTESINPKIYLHFCALTRN